MSKGQKAFVGGVTILGLFGLISKVIGMFFRVPLTNMIGSEGMGLYQAGYNVYTWLLSLGTAGIPVAISRLVAESVAVNAHKTARQILKTSLLLLVAVGGTLAVVLVLGARPLAQVTGDPEAALGLQMIAPAILAVSVLAAIRGYIQGHGNMAPTAISQLLEQIAKILISFPLASYGLQFGVAYAAAGALLGITLGEIIAMLYLVIVYCKKRKLYIPMESAQETPVPSAKSLVKTLIQIAVPITIGSMIVPLSSFVDWAMIRLRLMTAGFPVEAARSMYGLLSGSVISLINVPTVLATAVCIGLVPVISAARVGKRIDEMHDQSRLGLRLGSLIGMPCAIGLSMLAAPVVRLLYPALPAAEIVVTGEILSLSALTIFFFTQVQASTGILQGAGLQKIPMVTLLLGVLCKIVLNFILIGIPAINILGAPIASLACYAVSMGINIAVICRKTGMHFDVGAILVKPALATLGMAGAIALFMQVMNMQSRWAAIFGVFVGGSVYLVLVFAFGALQASDMPNIPGGERLGRLLAKVKLLR